MKIAVIGEFRLPAGAFDDARPVMRTMLEATRAEAGCISYAFAQDVLEPDLVRISEVWESPSPKCRNGTPTWTRR